MSETEKAIENLNTAKLILCNQQMLTSEMCIRIGQAVTDAIALLKEQEKLEERLQHAVEAGEEFRKELEIKSKLLKEHEVQELSIDEWREWKSDSKRDPICELWENDTSPTWILNPNDVHEPALLMGKLKLFTGKPIFEQCKAVKWND